MVDFPTSADIDYQAGEGGGVWTGAVKQFHDAVKQMVGAQAASELTISAGSATPTRGAHTIDTEADAAADDLTHLAQDNLPDGFHLLVSGQDAARVVTVKNAAGGAGQVLTVDGADFVLDAIDKWIWLKREGTSWKEVYRSYGADMAGFRTFMGLGNVANLKHNLAGAVAPVAGDDSGDGYAVGSRWIDVTNDKEYVCVDASATAAVWIETTGGAGGTDTVARDLAVSAMIAADAAQVLGGGGAFGAWSYRNDFETDNLATKTNASYDASADRYHNRGVVAISGATGTDQGDGSNTANAFDGNESQPRASAANSPSNNTALNIGKFYSGGKTITGYRAVGRSDHGFIETNDGGSFTLKLYGSNAGFKTSGVLLDSHTFNDTQTALEIDRRAIGSWTYDYFWLEIPASGDGTQDSGIAELVFYEAGSVADMTLADNAVALTGTETDALCYIRANDVDAVTEATDRLFKVSFDNGVNYVSYTSGDVTDLGSDGTYSLLRIELDLSAYTGTNLLWEYKTANSKEQQVRGIWLKAW